MSKEYPKTVKLKKGNVIVRPLEPADEKELLQFFRNLPEESTAYLKHDVRDPEVVKRFFTRRNSKYVWSILGMTEQGEIVGDATLLMRPSGWFQHIGKVRVVVAKAYRRQRLATMLIEELVVEATKRSLLRLEAVILDSQLGAHLALDQLGFRERAVLKKHALLPSGVLHDLIIMTTTINNLNSRKQRLYTNLRLPYAESEVSTNGS